MYNFLKYIFLLFSIISMMSVKILTTEGEYAVTYSKDYIAKVETKTDGFVTILKNNSKLKVFPYSEVSFNENDIPTLKKGILLFSDASKDDKTIEIKSKLFLDNSKGSCQFYRIQIPSDLKNITSNVRITYKNIDKDVTIDTKLHYIFEKNNSNYYGFFIPHFIQWETSLIITEIELYQNNDYFAKLINEIPVSAKEFENQTILFRPTKSKQISKTNKSKYNNERKIRSKIWDVNSSRIFFKNGFRLPFKDDSYISSEFGLTREWILSNKKVYSKDYHMGVDFARDRNTRIRASADGIVRFARYSEYYGNMVILEHGLSLFTNYCHMNKMFVKVGARVKKGDVIGLVGMTGAATGPHLHWEARIYQIPVDPRSFLNINEIFKP